MTTEAITTTSLTGHQLAEALGQVMPHMASTGSRAPLLEGVHFDSDGTFLHTVATDRYTMAVARRRLRTGEEWTATVGAMHVAYLQSWAEAHGYRDTVELTPSPGQLAVVSNMGRIVLPTMDGPHAPWRALFNRYLTEDAERVDISALDSQFMRRWEKAGRHLEITQSAPGRPLVLACEDFIGAQMPVRLTRGDAPSRAALASDWAGSLGFANEPGVDLPLPADGDQGPTTTETLLREVLISTQNLFDSPSEDHAALAAHARSGSHAWMAYRLLQVLRVIDPRTTELTLADLWEELDAGDFSETAFEDAEKLGHDPQAWVDKYVAARAKRAAEAATDAAAAEQAPAPALPAAPDSTTAETPEEFPPNGGHTGPMCAYVAGISSRCTCD